MVNSIEKSIRESDLGLILRLRGVLSIPIPELSQDRRIELAEVAGKYSEQAKISIRNVRSNWKYKEARKESEISEDKEIRREIQLITDEFINEIDDMLAQKEKDIKSVWLN